MKNCKDKWAFYKLPNRAPLSATEVAYWKNTVKKVLKIGMEFEFNLLEKKNGTCKRDNDSCPCVNLIQENSCWKECIYKAHCSHPNNRALKNCDNFVVGCNQKSCASCEKFSLKCSNILCTNFTSKCTVCGDYKIDCNACEYLYDPEKNPEHVRKLLQNELKPTNTYGQVGASGVHSIVTDGSLLGKSGAEIVTIGRRVDYWEYYKMISSIMDNSTKRGAYMNERCSIHMHALTSYYGKIVQNQENLGVPGSINELERDMPEIIVANLHQLVRRYQNAMTWMMMGLDDPNQMTRWEKFRVSVLEISPMKRHMREVMNEVASAAGGKKYGWINYNNMSFADNGDVRRLHVEFRACDGLLSASAVSAIGCMYYALILKAVEISRYGVLEVGSPEWMERAQLAKSAMLNNMRDYKDGDRFSNTSKLMDFKEVYIEEALDLVRQLKSTLIKIGPAYEVLEKLAEYPCALRRCDGHTWDRIEKDLEVKITEEDRLDIFINEVVTLNQITDCQNETEWIEEVGNLLRENSEFKDVGDPSGEIHKYLERHKDDGEIVWSRRIGAPILI